MKRFLFFLALCLAVGLGFWLTDKTHAQRPPLVLAFYYDWFDETTWSPSKVPDMPSPTYVSRDPGAMARQIQQARGAGIDAFVVSWWGAGNPTDDNFKVMLGQASAANFRLAVDFEVTAPFYNSKDDVIRSLKNLLANNAQNPAYLRVDGKPVVFFWREQKYSVDEWRAIRDQVDPNRQSIWIAEGVKEQLPYLSVFDGFHLYSIAWAPDVAAELQKWPSRVKAYGADKTWVATVMPGADNSKSPQADKVIRDRRGGDFYRETWNAAFATYPDWIIITSWNEWVEGTMIEPSVSYGNLYLDITRGLAAQFHSGLPAPTPTSTKAPTLTPTATLTPTLKATAVPTRLKILPGTRATLSDTARVRATPSASGEILGYIGEGTEVTLLSPSDDGLWWQIPYPSGDLRGWVSSDYIDVGNTQDPLALSSDTPTPTPTPTLQPTSTLTPTRVPDTATPKATATPTRTPIPGFAFPALKDIFPFLP